MIELSEPVVGYRWWRGTADGRLMRPFALDAANAAWTPGVNVATCTPVFGGSPRCKGTVPVPRCGCGLHAYVRMPQLADFNVDFSDRIGQSRQAYAGVRIIVGAVLLWGRMLSGGRCVRASHAEILAVCGATAGDAAKYYGVPHVGDEVLRAVALEHGAELSDDVVEQLHDECHIPGLPGREAA